MANKRELEIHTVIVDGDYNSFKAAITRSVLGVTYRKFKRKGREFYQHRIHNVAITQRMCDWLYEYLLARTPLKNMTNFKIKTDLTLRWSGTGEILGLSNVTVSVYLKVGELTVQELQVHKKYEKTKIDLFYSEIDVASQKLRHQLPDIIESVGKENFDYNEYDFLSDKGKKMAQVYRIERVPTVVINDKPFQNPDEKKLRAEIELSFTPQVKPTKAQFLLEPMTKPTVKSLATVLEV